MTDINKQIIAMGDGGTNGKDPLLDLYILAQSGKKNPRVCFLGTASADNQDYIKYFLKLFSRYPCEPTYLSLFGPNVSDIRSHILASDIIYVGGGHTKNMLAVWRDWGVDEYLLEAYNNGTILSGGSAGSVCWFKECITDSFYGALTVMSCLGILPYSNCPHFGSKERKDVYTSFLAEKKISEGYACEDHTALHFINGKLARCVSNDPVATCYQLTAVDKTVNLKRLRTEWLGVQNNQDKYIWDTETFADMSSDEDDMADSTPQLPPVQDQ